MMSVWLNLTSDPSGRAGRQLADAKERKFQCGVQGHEAMGPCVEKLVGQGPFPALPRSAWLEEPYHYCRVCPGVKRICSHVRHVKGVNTHTEFVWLKLNLYRCSKLHRTTNGRSIAPMAEVESIDKDVELQYPEAGMESPQGKEKPVPPAWRSMVGANLMLPSGND